MATADDPNGLVHKVGMHYRAGGWFAAPHHPTVLTLTRGVLRATTDDGSVLFDAPLDQFTARFSRWATLVLTHGGFAFHFVSGSYAGASARPFTDAQREELARAGGAEPDDGSTYRAGADASRGTSSGPGSTRGVGGTLNVGARVAGAAVMFHEQYRDFHHSLGWAEFLESQGVPTTYSTKKYATSAWTAAAIVLSALVVFVGGMLLLALLT